MGFKYFDILDTPYKRDEETREIFILRPTPDGKVVEEKPTPREAEKFSRNWRDSGVISEEIAYKLALDPMLSY